VNDDAALLPGASQRKESAPCRAEGSHPSDLVFDPVPDVLVGMGSGDAHGYCDEARQREEWRAPWPGGGVSAE
jgi:hypothetical protein